MAVQRVSVGRYFLYADDSAEPGSKIVRAGVGYEPHIRKELERLRPSGFLDIGANVGIHSVSVKDINPDCKVVAVEVSPDNVNLLCETVADNDFRDFIIIPVAAASRARLIGCNDDRANTSCGQRKIGGFQRWIPALPISFFNLPKVDVVKIDVEGFEYEVWQGMEPMISAGVAMIFEFTPGRCENDTDFQLGLRSGVTPELQLQWLLDRGYLLTLLGPERVSFNDAGDLVRHARQIDWYADVLAERT